MGGVMGLLEWEAGAGASLTPSGSVCGLTAPYQLLRDLLLSILNKV